MALSTDEMLFNVLFTQIVRRAPIGAVNARVREPIFRERAPAAPMRRHDAGDVAESGNAMFINSKPRRAFAFHIESPLSAGPPCSVG